MKGTTIYAKATGMEIKADTKVTAEDNGATRKEGRIALRFFSFGNGDAKNIRFLMTPQESFAVYFKALEVAKNGGKGTFTHKFTKDGSEIKTELTVEKWVNGERCGYAYMIQRGNDKVNVPVSLSDLLYTAELMKSLSVDQSWSSYKTADGQETDALANLPSNDSEEITNMGTDSGAPEPTEKGEPDPSVSAANSGDIVSGNVESTKRDGTGFKLGGKWYEVNDATEGREAIVWKNNVKVTFAPANRENGNPVALRVEAAA